MCLRDCPLRFVFLALTLALGDEPADQDEQKHRGKGHREVHVNFAIGRYLRNFRVFLIYASLAMSIFGRIGHVLVLHQLTTFQALFS